MNDMDFHNMVASRLGAIEASMLVVQKTLGALEAKMHMPADCDLADRVRGLELWRAGIVAVGSFVIVTIGVVLAWFNRK